MKPARFSQLWYLTTEAREAREAAHKHFETCEICKGPEWCPHGFKLWKAYMALKSRDRLAAREND